MSEREAELLEQLLAWTKFAHRRAFIETLQETLKDPRHLRAYELSDGQRTQPEVAKACGLSQPTISNLWAKWRRLGLVLDRGGRVVHLVQPSDLGMEVPPGPGQKVEVSSG